MGMRIHSFACMLFINVHTKRERVVHTSLQKLVHSSRRFNARHYEQQVTCDPASCPEQHHQAISGLSLEGVKLVHAIFSHLKRVDAALLDLFFECGWCHDLGERRRSKHGRIYQKRRETWMRRLHGICLLW